MAKKATSLNEAFAQFLGAEWFDKPNFNAPVPGQRQPNTALAQYLSTHGKPGPTVKPFADSYTKKGAATEKPSILNQIFDFLDQVTLARPARNIAHTVLDGKGSIGSDIADIGKALVGDVAGVAQEILPPGLDEKANALSKKWNPDIRGKVIAEDLNNLGFGGLEDKYSRGVAGGVFEFLLDPSLLLGGGLVKGGVKAAEKTADAALTMKAADKAATDATAFVKPELPKPELPPVANMATSGGKVQARDFVPPPSQQVLPLAHEPSPNIFTQAGSQEVGYNILNDPASLAEMKKAKRSDDGWRAAQIRHGRNPDVEQAHLDNAISKGAWFEQKKQEKLAKAGKVTDGKGDVSQVGIGRVIEDIQTGKIPSWGPEPIKATGLARERAIVEADNQINAILAKGTKTEFNPANQANLYNRMFNATADILKNDPELAKKFTVVESAVKLSKDQKDLVKELHSIAGDNVDHLIDEVNILHGRKVINKATRDKLIQHFKTTNKAVNVNSPRALAARRTMARAMLATAEDHLISLGKVPQYWDGTGLRLSHVLEEIGVVGNDELATRVLNAWKTGSMKNIKEPAVAEAITRALARRPLHLSSLLEDASIRAKEVTNNILSNYTNPAAIRELSKLPDYAEDIVRRAGFTDEEIKATRKLVEDIANKDVIPPERFLRVVGGRLLDAVKAGKVDKDALARFNKEIDKVLGDTRKDFMTNINGNKFVDGFMLRFSTMHGRLPEMKRFSDDVMTWGEMNAVARARWLRNMVKASGNSPEVTYSALKMAQGMMPKSESFGAVEKKLADQITDYFETMLSSSGMRDVVSENATAVRSQMLMDDINKQLKAVGSKFQFTNAKDVKDPFLGLKHDFSEDWLSSWKLHDPKGQGQDAVSFLYDMDVAIERTTKEYALVDEFVRNFGFKKGEAGFDKTQHIATLTHNRVPNGVYFDPETRNMMKRLLNDLDEGLWRPQSKLIQHYSRGLRIWKTGVTIYTPSHHIRNLIGDLHMMWWAGHNDPRNFIRAAKILQSQRKRYEAAMKSDTLDALKGLVDKDALEWAKTKGGDTIIRQNGVDLTAEQIYIAAHQHGLLLDANKYEDIFGQAPLENLPGMGRLPEGLQKRIASPLNNKAHDFAAKTLAENREHYVRIAHFVGAINKGLKKSKDIDKVFREAAHEVRKWHPDGRDLTKFEQKARMVIPFYSWTRKALPLVVQTAVTRPSKVLYYPRAQMALSEMLGTTENPTMLDPFPDNQLFPEWIRAKGIGPAFDPMSDDPFSAFFGKLGRNTVNNEGQETGYVIANPSNPFQDIVEQIGGFSGSPMSSFKQFFDSSTPALKIPGEIAFDKTFSGAPIRKENGGKGMFNYLFNQIPIVSMGNNVVEWEPGVDKKPNGREGGKDVQALINYLTAAGLRGTGPYVKTAEFEAKAREKNAR